MSEQNPAHDQVCQVLVTCLMKAQLLGGPRPSPMATKRNGVTCYTMALPNQGSGMGSAGPILGEMIATEYLKASRLPVDQPLLPTDLLPLSHPVDLALSVQSAFVVCPMDSERNEAMSVSLKSPRLPGGKPPRVTSFAGPWLAVSREIRTEQPSLHGYPGGRLHS